MARENHSARISVVVILELLLYNLRGAEIEGDGVATGTILDYE